MKEIVKKWDSISLVKRIICGLIGGIDDYALSPIQWIFAAIMILGIAMVGNLNPLNIFKKKEA